MNKSRLEAFSDGVLAIIITIMVLELKTPHGSEWSALLEVYPFAISYALSFVFVGIYWGNHHHLFHTFQHIDGGVIWANMHLLFWLSLVPFGTDWMGENHFARNSVILYAIILLMCGVSFTILQLSIQRINKHNARFGQALEKVMRKGIFSLVCYSLSIPIAFYNTMISGALFVLVSIFWIVPDRNIERALGRNEDE